MLKTIGKRVPPGDRWEVEECAEIFSSLTEALNQIYIKYNVAEFTMNAQNGTIEIDDGTEAPPEPPKTWDLYGEK
jgi:hypothetical protein